MNLANEQNLKRKAAGKTPATLQISSSTMNSSSTLPANGNSPPVALYSVRVTLELIDPPASTATAIAHSALSPEDGTRLIRIGLRPAHLLVTRALHRADTLHIRFLAGLSLVEYCLFWRYTSDGKAVFNALRQAAGYGPGERAWGSGFATRLAISELLLPIDLLPIFGPSPKTGPHPLGTIKIVGRSPSDIPRWRTRNGSREPEAGEPIPKRQSSTSASAPTPAQATPVASPVISNENSGRAPVITFAERFLERAHEMLDASTYQALAELTGETNNE